MHNHDLRCHVWAQSLALYPKTKKELWSIAKSICFYWFHINTKWPLGSPENIPEDRTYFHLGCFWPYKTLCWATVLRAFLSQQFSLPYLTRMSLWFWMGMHGMVSWMSCNGVGSPSPIGYYHDISLLENVIPRSFPGPAKVGHRLG